MQLFLMPYMALLDCQMAWLQGLASFGGYTPRR